MRVTIFDYGAGNLHSLAKAVALTGVTPRIESNPARAVNTDALLLPGVGAFATAAERLAPGRAVMRDAISAGLPCLGICLGMHLLFDGSDEGPGPGLGLVAGHVIRLVARRVPQIGWSRIEEVSEPLIAGVGLDSAYYANSYVARPIDASAITSWGTHEQDRFPASVRAGRAVGVQFHPEKSSSAGLRFLAAFVNEARS